MTQSPLRCHLLIGPPASGKTTLARDLAPLLDQLLAHLTRIKVARLAAHLATDLQLPWAELAQRHSRHLGGGRRWLSVGRTAERLDLAATA